jgi:hypothetical protein
VPDAWLAVVVVPEILARTYYHAVILYTNQ